MKYQILNGDNVNILKTLPDNSIDSIITDPPYGIAFLGKEWDHKRATETTSKIAQLHNLPSGMKHTTLADDLEFQYWLRERWIECLRVLKPGGHVLAFSAARTYHHMAMSLQTAGFEIRDQIMWIYSSGFPKSQDVGKSIERNERKDGSEWAGWGTALKPAHEPICMARKPVKQSIAKNVQEYGTGALNIDETRISYDGANDKPVPHGGKARLAADNEGWHKNNTGWKVIEDPQINEIGRFPSNVIGEIAEPYQKYFYCPKVSRQERHMGYDLDVIPTNPDGMMSRDENGQLVNNYTAKKADAGNNHPTVKPVELMKYLIKLVTPPNGKVLDPFNGSGSTGMAAVELGHEYIGIEQDEKYCEISRRRISAHFKKSDPLRASGLFE